MDDKGGRERQGDSPAKRPQPRRFPVGDRVGIQIVRLLASWSKVSCSRWAKALALEYGIDYRTPIFAIHKKGHYGSIVGHAFSDLKDIPL